MRPIAIALALAAGLLATTAPPPARAGTVVVTDSGNLGEFTFTNEGVSAGGTATILVSVPDVGSAMNTVNGATIPAEASAVAGPITLLVTPAGADAYDLALVPATYVDAIGAAAGARAELAFDLTHGATPAALPDFFNASGAVTALLANANPTYDFGGFAGGAGVINFTFTATSFGGASSFAGLFATAGATAVGNGSFSQAVPEPSGPLLLGLGLAAAAAAIRRRRGGTS
jgi:PEP-CTERM motif